MLIECKDCGEIHHKYECQIKQYPCPFEEECVHNCKRTKFTPKERYHPCFEQKSEGCMECGKKDTKKWIETRGGKVRFCKDKCLKKFVNRTWIKQGEM